MDKLGYWFWILGKIVGRWPRESDFPWKKFSQKWKCNGKPKKLHCWVASNLWSGLAPDFRPKIWSEAWSEVTVDPTKNHIHWGIELYCHFFRVPWASYHTFVAPVSLFSFGYCGWSAVRALMLMTAHFQVRTWRTNSFSRECVAIFLNFLTVKTKYVLLSIHVRLHISYLKNSYKL